MVSKLNADEAIVYPKYQCAVYKTYFVVDSDLCKDICTLKSGPYQKSKLENYIGTYGYMYSKEKEKAQYIVQLIGRNKVILDFIYFGNDYIGLRDRKETFNKQNETVSISLDLRPYGQSKAGELAEVKLVCGPEQ